jgi:hypothetical protein
MKRSDRRILTSHVGSLPRPDALVELKQAKCAGETCNASVFAAQLATASQYPADERMGERDGIDRQFRTSTWFMAGAIQSSTQPLDPLSARRPRLERIAEVLGLARHLPVSELHDAHRVRRPYIVSDDEFRDPEVGSAEYPPQCEALFARLSKARRLNIAPAADALARLRVLEHRILAVNLVLRLKVVGVGGGPVAIQGRSDIVVVHLDLLSLTLALHLCAYGLVEPGEGVPHRLRNNSKIDDDVALRSSAADQRIALGWWMSSSEQRLPCRPKRRS